MAKLTGPRLDPIEAKDPKTATAAEADRAQLSDDNPAGPKATAKAQGETPVSGAVNEGDTVVNRNDAEGTLGPVADGGKPFISEGVRNDIEQYGHSVDPNTGRTLTKDDLK